MNQNSTANRKHEAFQHIAIYRAAEVSETYFQQQHQKAERKAKFSKSTEALARKVSEFRLFLCQTELRIRDSVNAMTEEEEMLETLFDLFDVDGSGRIGLEDLSQSLLKVDGQQKTAQEAFETAKISITAFDSDDNGMLDKDEFRTFISAMSKNVDADFSDIVRFLILRVALAKGGGGGGDIVLDEEVRTCVLYKAFDSTKQGYADFKNVVKSMKWVSNQMDEQFRNILFAVDKNTTRQLNLVQFSGFLFSVVSASPPHINFHEVANSITESLCDTQNQKEKDLNELFDTHTIQHHSLETTTTATTTTTTKSLSPTRVSITAQQYEKVKMLFDLWDLNHSGQINFEEFFLGLRKFHDTKDYATTFAETTAAMSRFDINEANGKLDLIEFSMALSEFASYSNVDLEELIDFMVVKSALTHNSDTERNYLARMTKRQQIRQQMGRLWRGSIENVKDIHLSHFLIPINNRMNTTSVEGLSS